MGWGDEKERDIRSKTETTKDGVSRVGGRREGQKRGLRSMSMDPQGMDMDLRSMGMDLRRMDIIFTGNAVFDSPEETDIKQLIERAGSLNRENHRMSCDNEGNEERFSGGRPRFR